MIDTASSTGPPLPPRRRILNAALELAIEGGYENVHVRALSERAGVSSRTIYTHFDSLDSLLILAIAEQSQDLYRRYTESPPNGRTAVVRVGRLIAELTETMTATRDLTVALIRALLSGKPDVAPWVHAFGDVLQELLASAIAPGGPTSHDREIAEILQGVWFSALVGWVTGADSEEHVNEILRRSARALLEHAPHDRRRGTARRAGSPATNRK
jgi:TetR/AcrR family transcriptional regulator, cholesterol catabolism regulator